MTEDEMSNMENMERSLSSFVKAMLGVGLILCAASMIIFVAENLVLSLSAFLALAGVSLFSLSLLCYTCYPLISRLMKRVRTKLYPDA